MKVNQDTEANDDLREEYDFASMKGGVRGKYAKDFEVFLKKFFVGIFESLWPADPPSKQYNTSHDHDR